MVWTYWQCTSNTKKCLFFSYCRKYFVQQVSISIYRSTRNIGDNFKQVSLNSTIFILYSDGLTIQVSVYICLIESTKYSIATVNNKQLQNVMFTQNAQAQQVFRVFRTAASGRCASALQRRLAPSLARVAGRSDVTAPRPLSPCLLGKLARPVISKFTSLCTQLAHQPVVNLAYY